MPMAAITLFILGCATYRLIISRIMKSPMLFQILTTFGLAFLINYTLFLVAKPTFRTVKVGFWNGCFRCAGVYIDKAMVAAAVACILAFIFLYVFLHYTRTGKGIRATTDNPKAALALGVNIERMYTLTWGISSALVAVAGVMLSRMLYVHPTVGDRFGLLAFVAVALGGFGSIYGALLGGLVIGVFSTLAGVYAVPWMKFPSIFAVFVFVLLVRPQGLFGRK